MTLRQHTPRIPDSLGHLKRSILSGLEEIVMSIFGGRSSAGYSHATNVKIKTNLHIFNKIKIYRVDKLRVSLFSLI